MSTSSPGGPGVVSLVLVALLAAGCSAPTRAESLAGGRHPRGTPASARAPASAAASPRPSAAPWTPAPRPPAAPFDLVVDRVSTTSADNAEILGLAPPPVDPAAVEAAVTAVRIRLRDFLTRQFAQPTTRFSRGPVEELLSARARLLLDGPRLEGLGAIDLPVLRTVTGPARATMEVAAVGSEVRSVLVTYEAHLTAVLPGLRAPLRQRGVLVFLPTDEGWRAELADVTLERPAPPASRPRHLGAVR